MLLDSFFTIPVASAHEVYVLSGKVITDVVSNPSPNPFSAVSDHLGEFVEWGFFVAVGLFIIGLLAYSKKFSMFFEPVLRRLKPVAHFVARITLGASLFASGYYQAFFGPELSFKQDFLPAIEPFVAVIFMGLGIFIMLGIMTRVCTLIGLVFFGMAVAMYHSYMLTYVNYCGELLLLLILGSGRFALDNHHPHLRLLDKQFRHLHRIFEKYGFFILRVLFGIALIYASMYAKFLHSNLALDTVNDYNLTRYFHFTPLFLVLGAFIIEFLIGLAFIIGFGVRFFALFFLCFLTASLLFFGEAVWPHIILIGVAITIFLHGYDKYTVMMHLPKRQIKEPVL
ncbi:MAG: DoxX family protein [Candidatus Andersenbacteria bacterium]